MPHQFYKIGFETLQNNCRNRTKGKKCKKLKTSNGEDSLGRKLYIYETCDSVGKRVYNKCPIARRLVRIF